MAFAMGGVPHAGSQHLLMKVKEESEKTDLKPNIQSEVYTCLPHARLDYGIASTLPFHELPIRITHLLGASVRNSTHGKGHEEGSLAYAKA